MSTVVAGVDFGTLSVRVSIFDSEQGRLGAGVAEYPLHRKRDDPDFATQSHEDHMSALALAIERAVQSAGIHGSAIQALALDTTGSSVIPVGQNLEPLDDYYLWCDHRAWREAAEITDKAHESGLLAIKWCGGTYSSEWGFSKLLHWLRHNPDKRERFVTAFEHCDYVATVLCGIHNVADAPRSICAMGHKWMWNESIGGFPPEGFLTSVDPLLNGMRGKLGGRYLTSNAIAGTLSGIWAQRLGLQPGIPIPVGAFDAHWDAIGAGVKIGDVVNVIGTSTCIIGLSDKTSLVPGVCGVVPGSVDPGLTGIEAGLSAVGDMFDAIARRAGTTVAQLSQGLEDFKAGQTGLLRMSWDNGDRTVLVNPELGGVTFGWHLTSTAQDELFAAIEGTAFHTRIILSRMAEHGTVVERIINGGGIPQKNAALNQVYANVLNKPILVPQGDVTSLGSAIFAFLAAKAFPSIEAAQNALCPSFRMYVPQKESVLVYEELFRIYKRLYFGMGMKKSEAVAMGDVLPQLRRIAARPEVYEMMLAALREEVLEANLALVRRGLVVFTFGNASGFDAASGLVVIKPSGVPYDVLKASDLVVTDLEGKVVEGSMRPSSDEPTHRALYKAFPGVHGVVHTHSRYATSWAQAAIEIPCYGTTHADYFPGPVPVTPPMTASEIESEYEWNTGQVIISRFRDLDPLHTPAVLVANHAPFCWGPSVTAAAHTAEVLEEIAHMAYLTVTIRGGAECISDSLHRKHFFRKHGPGAYYGQVK